MISIILGFGLLILIHELGHFVAARCFGVKVEKFSIGMGPSVIGFKKNDTYYQIGLIPFGGFCQFKEDALRDDLPLLLNNDNYEYLNSKITPKASGLLEDCYVKTLPKNMTIEVYEKIKQCEESSDKESILGCYYFSEAENKYLRKDDLTEKDIFVSMEFLEARKINSFEYKIKDNCDNLKKSQLIKLLYKFTDVKKFRDADSFFGIPSWKRLFIAFCGPLMNFILAVIFLGFLAGTPHKEIYLPNKVLLIDDVIKNQKSSPAKIGGILTGDYIRKINGKTIDSFQQLSEEMVLATGKKTITVTVERAGKMVDLIITPEWDKNGLKPVIGVYYYNEPVLKINKNNPLAEYLKLQDKDKVVSVNGSTECITDITVNKYFQENYKSNNISVIEISRAGNKIKIDINFNELSKKVDSEKDFGFLFYYPERNQWISNPFEALVKGFDDSKKIIYMTSIGMVSLITKPKGDISEQLGGPIKIGYFMKSITDAGFSQSFYEGLRNFMLIVSYISLALAFFNLIPFPALDGGYILISLFEIITRRTVKMRTIYILNFIGFAILITMAIVVAFMDIKFLNNTLHK